MEIFKFLKKVMEGVSFWASGVESGAAILIMRCDPTYFPTLIASYGRASRWEKLVGVASPQLLI